MIGSGISSLGIFLLVTGLLFFVAAYLILRVIPKIRPQNTTQLKPNPSSDIPAHSDAVLVVTPGGRISYLNEAARDWFNLWEEPPI